MLSVLSKVLNLVFMQQLSLYSIFIRLLVTNTTNFWPARESKSGKRLLAHQHRQRTFNGWLPHARKHCSKHLHVLTHLMLINTLEDRYSSSSFTNEAYRHREVT